MSAIATLLTDWTAAHKRDSGSSTSSHPAQWLIDWVNGGAASSSGVHVNASSALKYTPFWAAVRIISGTLGACPFKTFEHLKAGGKRPVPEHPAYTLLHDRPNDYMDAITFKETRQAHVLCYGNGYAEIQRDGGGRPVALWPLLPDKTTRKMTPKGTPYYEVRTPDNQTVTLADENVLHVKGLGFDGYTGYDVVTFHREALGYGMAVKEFGSRFFSNGASPGGVLEHPNTLGKPALEHLKESWNAQHQGLSNAHRLQILEEGMKFHETGVDPKKAQALEVQKWTVDDCSRIFQIPPHKLGSMEFSKYNNVEQLNIDFYCTTMLYWFCKWEQEVDYKLFMPSERGRIFAEIIADAVLRGNIKDRYEAYGIGRQWGFLNINDIHAKENMNPIGPAGDVYLDPLNMVPAGTLPKNPSTNGAADDDANKGRSDAVYQAHRVLLAGQWRRIITKQNNANGQRESAQWWENHRTWAGTLLLDGAVAYAAVQGMNRDSASAAVRGLIGGEIATGVTLKEQDAEWLAEKLMQEIGGNHAIP